MIRRPPRSTQSRSSAASDVYKRQIKKQREELKVKNKKRKRTNSLLGLFGSFFVVALILAGIAIIILFRLFIKAFIDWGNSSV